MEVERGLRSMLRKELAAALHIGSDELHLDESFFAQGGDSLSAIGFMTKCRMAGIETDIVDILQAKTLFGLIDSIVVEHDSKNTGPLVGQPGDTAFPTSDNDMLSGDLQPVPPDLVAGPGRIMESRGPCSSMQNRILISQAVNPDVYQCLFVLRAESPNPEALTTDTVTALWTRIVAYHPALRTTFAESDLRPSTFDQFVWADVAPPVTVLEHDDQVSQEDMMAELAQLDGTAMLPHHLYIYTDSPGKVTLWLSISHSVIDGQSAGIVLRDLYAAFMNELPAGTQRMTHADFVGLEEQDDDDEALSKDKGTGTANFWSHYLEGAEEVYLEGAVANSTSNKPKVGLRTLSECMPIGAESSRQFCDRHGVTMVNVCQMAWGMVLRFFALKDDVTFSYVTSGRQSDLPGIHDAVGLFIRSLVLRLDFTNDPRVVDMLTTISRDVFASMAHDTVPLVSAGAPSNLPTAQRWGNSILSFGKAWQAPLSGVDALKFDVVRRISPTDYDHSLHIEFGPESISVDYDIWESTVSLSDATKMLRCFLRAVNFILANPEARVGDFDTISDGDVKYLHDLNGNGREPVEKCIHSMVQQVTDTQPDAPAVYAWDGEMTFSELDAAASSLAQHLVTESQVTTETMVGICMSKSRWAVISMLAVLKAGGVVVPLSADQPLARLEIVLKDTKMPLILVDAAQNVRLVDAGVPLLEVNEALVADLHPVRGFACTTTKPANAAWVVYTSGSTGVPKGVVLGHQALSTSIMAHGPAFGVTFKSRVLQFASHTFDVTIQEVFTTLCLGGCVCVPSEEDRVNGLSDFIAKAKVNFLSLTSTVAGLLNPAQLPQVKNVILMGEPVKQAVMDMWKDQAVVLESYAPSECSIYATVSPKPMRDISQVPVLGVPLASCFWVVHPDDYNRLCPLGAPGELLIEGPLLAHGYLNDLAKTKSAFLEDPGFVAKYGLGLNRPRRMYRTGDLVRRNDDGSYTTLGRKGTQIKIHGQRVEVGEIEHHIAGHPSSTQAVVVWVRRGGAHGRLVAAFQPANGASKEGCPNTHDAIDKEAAILLATEIQVYLSQHLPDYMIPRLWIPIDSIPVNSSGKADRRSLTTWIDQLNSDEFAALALYEEQLTNEGEDLPATMVEKQLREVWSTVLNVPLGRISYRRSFLSHGGDSITAMQVVSACRHRGLMLKVRDVLMSAAIPDLALQVRTASSTEGLFTIPDGLFPLAPAQRVFFRDMAGDGIRADGPFRFNQSACLNLRQTVPQASVARAVETLVARHAMLRARFEHVTSDSSRSSGDSDGTSMNTSTSMLNSTIMSGTNSSDESTRDSSGSNVSSSSSVHSGDEHSVSATALPGTWKQRIEKHLVGSYRFQTYHAADDTAATAIMRQSQGSLDLEKGPVFAADLIELPDRQLLFLTAHHLVVDLMSWRILAHDLDQVLQSRKVPSESLPFSAWCALLSERMAAEAGPNISKPSRTLANTPSPYWEYWGLEPSEHVVGNICFSTAKLDKDSTSLLLGTANNALRTNPTDILLAALHVSFQETFTNRPAGLESPSVFVENHGRQDSELADMELDLSETVGWFTTMLQLRFSKTAEDTDDFLSLVRQIKDGRHQHAQRATLDFARRSLASLDEQPLMEVLFNYHGQFQQVERSDGLLSLDRLHQQQPTVLDNGSVGASVKQPAVLTVEVSVEAGEANISVGFSRKGQRTAEIQKWLENYRKRLAEGVEALMDAPVTATISDFPLAHLQSTDDLALLLQQCGSLASSWADIQDVLPCSPIQQGILLSQLKSPATYRLKQTFRVQPTSTNQEVDVDRLADAWRQVVRLHSVMRTIFTGCLSHRQEHNEEQEERFLQVVLREPPVDVRILKCHTDDDVQTTADDHTLVDDPLGGKPLHRFLIIKTDVGDVYGHFEISHALVDASSIQILVGTLLKAYEGSSTVGLGSLYSTYVSFLERHHHSQQDDLQYWTSLLEDTSPCYLQLGKQPDDDHESKAKTGIEGVQAVMMTLPDAASTALRTLCQTYGVTAATVYQLAWALVLSVYTESNHVCFGYLSSGRDVPIDGVDDLVGPMINTMIGTVPINRDQTIIDATRAIQARFLEGFDHQRASLGQIQHALSTGSPSLFNTTLSYRRTPAATVEKDDRAPTIHLESVSVEEPTEYDFNLTITEVDRGSTQMALHCRRSIATARTAQRLLSQLQHTVQTLVKGRQTGDTFPMLSQLDLLPDADLEVIRSNNQQQPAALEECIHTLVHAVAERQPEAPAVHAWDGDLTYRELDTLATTLAAHLQQTTPGGISADTMVALCMDKSRWATVAMLAVLKAGGAVVPLSTEQPLARLQIVLEDTKAPLILADAIQVKRLASLERQILKVDGHLLAALGTITQDESVPPVTVQPRNAAWVVYTSGSTGIPKGVVLQHAALATSIRSHGAAFGLNNKARVLQFAAHTFDVTIQETFTTLYYGGCVCIPSEFDRMNDLEQAIVNLEVNVLSLTSTVAGLLDPARLPRVHTMILIGEPVKPAVLDLWMHRADVLDAYGPSECSIQAAISPRPMTDRRQATILGTPLSSCCFWVVDPHDYHKLCPLGAPGELLIEGPHLAREYLNDKKKTDGSFVTDPGFVTKYAFGTENGRPRRMYRTGDLVRQNSDGTYTNFGRRDTQIKIHGQRVEVGEIEYHIGRHPSRTQAVVVFSRQNAVNSGHLVAAFKHDGGNDTEADKQAAMLLASEMQHHLASCVPDYMIPRVWMPLVKLPVNSSGKVDRLSITTTISALSADEFTALSAFEQQEGEDLPATAVEKQLREVWSTILNQPLSRVSYRRSFLSHGGDSITAMQVVSACRRRGLVLSVRDVLQSAAIPDLALQAKLSVAASGTAYTIPNGPFALSPAQNMFMRDIAPEGLRADGPNRFNQSVCFCLRQFTPPATVARAIETLVGRHAMLRARFEKKPEDSNDTIGAWQQRIEKRLVGSYHFQTHQAADDSTAQQIMLLSQSSLSLEHGPVFAADLLVLPDRQLLFLSAHHLVVDLMSWRIAAQDLEMLLRLETLPPLASVPFPAWSAALLDQASKVDTIANDNVKINTTSWEYWGLTAGQYPTSDQCFATARLSKETTTLLLGPGANTPLRTNPADILLAALYVSFQNEFSDHPGRPSVFVESHGRSSDLDVSDTVGWFTAVTPVTLSGNGTEETVDNSYSDSARFLAMLRQIKDARKLRPEGQDTLDFAAEYVQSCTQGTNAMPREPIEILFNYHGQFQQLERSDGLLVLDRLHQPVGYGGEDGSASVGGHVRQHAALTVEVSVETGGEAQIVAGFSRKSTRVDGIHAWLQRFSQTVEEGVHTLSNTAPVATVSDFPLAGLNHADLTALQRYCLVPANKEWKDVEDVLPCSPIQQGILLSQLRAPTTYRLQQTCRVRSLLTEPDGCSVAHHLADAWRQVVCQHSILRTMFTGTLSHQDRFYQVVLAAPEVDICMLEHIHEAELEKVILRHQLESDPVNGPAHRFIILVTTKGHVYGHFSISHALVDASSVQLVINDLLQAYESGGASPTPMRGSKYSSYVAFLEEHPEEEDLQYWTGLLNGVEPCHLQLRQALQTSESAAASAAESIPATEEVTATLHDLSALQAVSRTHGVTAASVCQLAWALVLAGQVESEQVCFGNLSSGRDVDIDGVDTLVGPMINMMIACIRIERNQSAAEAMQTIQSRFLDGFHHQRASMASIQHALSSHQQTTLFNTTLSYARATKLQGTTATNNSVAGRSIELEQTSAAESTEYDFNLFILEETDTNGNNGLAFVLRYRSAMATSQTAQRLLTQLRHNVQMLSRNADMPINSLDMLPPEDLIIYQLKNRRPPPAATTCIHTLVQQATDRRPDSAAIYAWDGNMTFRELDGAASTFAAHLMSLGVGPEVMVGICMDKSRWAVISMLAVLKAGGVVVPLSTDQPMARLQIVLNDTKAPLIMVDAAQHSRLGRLGRPLLLADARLLASLGHAREVSSAAVNADNAAWVVYTSGSTGLPKGVVLQHSALVTSIESHGPAFGVREDSRVLQFASHTFDVTIQEVFTTLCHGGCVCIPSEDERVNRLSDFIASAQVNFLSLTSTVAGLLVPARLPLIRTVILMGEPVKPAVMDLWKTTATVLESYAPSECSIYATVSPRPMTDIAQVPVLGVPLASCFWVVNPNDYNQLLPLGAPGELLIEGPLLARGYLNDMVKTDSVFLKDPGFVSKYGLGKGRRMYRTGDLVRLNDDGSYTTLGRQGTQIKIHGQRVEVDEIEYWTVRSVPAVHSAAAVLLKQIEEGHHTPSLFLALAVQFVESDETLTKANTDSNGLMEPTPRLLEVAEDIMSRLRRVLPRYMVPDLVVPMAQLPQNSSGKLDRRALSTLLQDSMSNEERERYRTSAATKADVTTDDERQLRQLWSTVLSRPVETIGANDNFFHLGGDSITAMRLIETSRGAHVILRVADVFAHPRLSELAVVGAQNRALAGNEGADESLMAPVPAPFSLWAEYAKLSHTTAAMAQSQTLLADIAARCDIATEQVDDVYPCTPLQEGLLLTTTRRPAAYISRQVFALAKDIDVDRFQAAWQTMADAAPILRTRILLGRGDNQNRNDNITGSIQVVTKVPLTWQTTADSSLENYLARDSAVSMAEGQPLVRFGLVNTSSGRFFVWSAHHSVFDGWSLLSMYRQVAKIYWESTTPRCQPYSLFLGYLTHVAEAEAETVATYWRSQLEGDPASDFPVLPHGSGGHYEPQPTQQVAHSWDLVRPAKTDVSLANLVRAAWALMVAQYTGNQDVVFAATLSGRNAPVAGITDILAPTITTVPVRVHVDPSADVRAFLQDVQKQATEMMPFEHTGLQRIRELVPDKAAALDVRHLFVVQPAAESESESGEAFPGLTPQGDMMTEAGFDGYALTVECRLGPGSRITVESRFDEDVVTIAAAEQMLSHFAHLTRQLAEAESKPRSYGSLALAQMEPLGPADLEQLRATHGQAPVTKPGSVHKMFLETAARQPNTKAVCAWDGDLTYSEVADRSAQLAQHLVGLGVTAEVSVGVCMDKSRWALVSMLAILRAGGTVVPLGVQLPLARLALIARDSAVDVLLADETHAARLARQSDVKLSCRIITINSSLWTTMPLASKIFQAAEPEPHQAAWVVYTSGSTGVPKGVVLEHRGIYTSMLSQAAAFGLGQHSRALQFAAHTFDAAIQEMFTTLCFGGCVCIPSEADRVNRLQDFLVSKRVNFLSLTPTVASLLHPEHLPLIQTIVLIGEPLKSAVLDLWMHHASVLDGYGPTECTVYSAVSTAPITNRKQVAVLGGALPSTCFWVVDPNDYNCLCPIGAPGELLIEGPHLARGYLNDTAKTASSFVVDPDFIGRYGLGSGRRMYRTGDLVRQNPDGTYTGLGRQDKQIKIHGQRVEIEEIEYWTVKSEPSIRSAAAILICREGNIDARLVIAVEMENSNSDGLLPATPQLMDIFSQVRGHLYAVLPRYMVPELFIPMAHLPLNSSGKLDRRAVTALLQEMSEGEWEQYRPSAAVKEVATEDERKLRTLWGRALGRPAESIGAGDNFFHLGGDSIIAMQLVAAGRAAGWKVSVAQVFQTPVLRDLCQHLVQDEEKKENQKLEGPKQVVDTATSNALREMLPGKEIRVILNTTDFQALVLQEHQAGRWMLYMTITYNNKIDADSVRQTLQHAVDETDILRTVFIGHSGQTYQVILDTLAVPFEVAQPHASTDLAGFCKAVRETDQEKTKEMAPSEPPFKVWFIQGEQHDAMVIRLSHAQYDGLSLPMLLEKLQGRAMSNTQTKQMPYYMDALQSTNRERAVEFWQGLLHGSASTALPAPAVGMPNPKAAQFQALNIPWKHEQTRPHTTVTYLKTAWAQTLAHASGSTDIVFGHLVSGRSLPVDGIESVQGPCVNLIPIRVDTAQSNEDILARIAEQQIDALPHEHLGFATIVRECTDWSVPKDKLPRFRTILQYQNLPLPDGYSNGDSNSNTMQLPNGQVSFDLLSPLVSDIWLTVIPADNELCLSAAFDASYVGTSTVASLLEDLRQNLDLI